ncbi:MAG: sigma-70 family RNA polymerase sigma factor [Phycisphaerae bacterium]|nr:sigma-70 family RNA polymerase sigma factor [Phycisphaerae bacterium]
MTQLLARLRCGEADVLDRLLPAVYDELRAMAGRCLRNQPPGQTLQPTALVHEAYIRLVDQTQVVASDRAHFVAVAAKVMRSALVDHVRSRHALKRGGERGRVPLDDALALFEARSVDLLALDEALAKLANMDEQQCRIIEMRFFGGLTMEEIAAVLGVSTRTVERDWRMARAWLRVQIQEGESDAG